MRRRQANIDAFNGMSLCQRRYETRVWTWGTDRARFDSVTFFLQNKVEDSWLW